MISTGPTMEVAALSPKTKSSLVNLWSMVETVLTREVLLELSALPG